MKKIILTISICILIFHSFGQHKFEIIGEIKGSVDDTTIYLVLIPSQDTIVKTRIHNGQFIFKGELPSSGIWASVRVGGSKKWSAFILEKGNCKISGALNDWSKAMVSGSAETDVYYAYQKKSNRVREMLRIYNSAIPIAKNDSDKKFVRDKIDSLRQEMDLLGQKFIEEHSQSVYTAWLILNIWGNDDKKMEEEYSRLTSSVQQSPFGVELMKRINEIKARKLNDSKLILMRKSIAQGAPSPDLFLQSDDNKALRLKEITARHTLTLVYFWASWSDPWRKFNDDLEHLYKEFSDDGFTIVSISLDKTDSDWRKGLNEVKTDWINVRNKEGEISSKDIFDVQFFPAFMLIDQEGKLVALENYQSSVTSFGFANSGNLRKDLYDKVNQLMIISKMKGKKPTN